MEYKCMNLWMVVGFPRSLVGSLPPKYWPPATNILEFGEKHQIFK